MLNHPPRFEADWPEPTMPDDKAPDRQYGVAFPLLGAFAVYLAGGVTVYALAVGGWLLALLAVVAVLAVALALRAVSKP